MSGFLPFIFFKSFSKIKNLYLPKFKINDILVSAVKYFRLAEQPHVRVAQLDRASGYGPEGHGFKSCYAQRRNSLQIQHLQGVFFISKFPFDFNFYRFFCSHLVVSTN